MRASTWSLSALALLADVRGASARTIVSSRHFQGYRDGDNALNVRDEHNSDFDRRSAQQDNPTVLPPATNTTNPPQVSTDGSAAITESCLKALQGRVSSRNAAGFIGCYNILQWDPATTAFTADLRIYTTEQQSQQFANVTSDMKVILLNFPKSTAFITLSTSDTTDMQQFTLSGNLDLPMDLTKLSEIQLASLLVPQIDIQATSPKTRESFSAVMTPEDTAYFTTGQFTGLAASIKEVADLNTSTNAIAIAQIFVLPGTTFGIFPVGFIITSIWALLFVLTYGAGTIARFRYRSIYRKRMATIGKPKHSIAAPARI